MAGGWRNRGRLTYAARGPYRYPVDSTTHDGRDGSVQVNAAQRISGPVRQGPGEPALIDDQTAYTTDQGRGWRGDRTPQSAAYGYVGAGGASIRQEHAQAYAAHSEDLGAVEDVITERPAMFQLERTVRGWNRPRINALGHGSQAALGRGLNGLDMNNDPAQQHYAIDQVGVGRVDRKIPGRRIWTQYLTPFRMRVAASAVSSRPSEVSPATSWAPTLTLGRTGKTSVPMLRRAPRDWTEAVTIDDSNSSVADYAEPSWGL